MDFGLLVYQTTESGGMAEWLKAAVLKTVERKLRGFESYSLRHCAIISGDYVSTTPDVTIEVSIESDVIEFRSRANFPPGFFRFTWPFLPYRFQFLPDLSVRHGSFKIIWDQKLSF